MHQHKITPYEGQEPYIFISYAHRDSDRVLPVLEELDRRNYRIWYDDGIAPGSEWPENIAQHLNDSALIIAFVSPNSIASANCRREVTFALAKKKPFLGIVLEETEMSLGMEMQLSAQQCIMKYQYQSEERFLEKLCSCPDIAPCLIPQEIQQAPEEVEAVAEEIPAKEEQPREQEQKEALAAALAEKKICAVKVKKERTVKPKQKKKRRGKTLLLVLGSIAAVLALCIILPFVCQVRITDNKTVSPGSQTLILSQETITAKSIRQINRLKKLRYITFRECTFETGALAVLNLPKEMQEVQLENCSGVDALGFLSKLSGLKYLELSGCDLSPASIPDLQMPELRKLDISGNARLLSLSFCIACTNLQQLNASNTNVHTNSLSYLSKMELTELSFAGTKVTDVTALGGMSTLRSIDGSNTQVTNIDALAGLRELVTLDFSDCKIEKIGEQFSCLRLCDLFLDGNPLTDVSAFSDCTILERVDFSGTKVHDIAFLEKSSEDLKALGVSDCPIPGENLNFLRNCTELDTLYIDGIKTQTLQFLGNARHLEVLSAVNCGIQDISALVNCTQLTKLYLAQNQIRSIDVLRNLENKYVDLDLSFNGISKYQALEEENFKILCLIGNQIYTTGLQTRCQMLVISYSDALLEAWVKKMDCNEYWVIGCPADKQVKLEEHLGAKRLLLVDTWGDLANLLEQEGINADYLRNME